MILDNLKERHFFINAKKQVMFTILVQTRVSSNGKEHSYSLSRMDFRGFFRKEKHLIMLEKTKTNGGLPCNGRNAQETGQK